MHTSRLGALSLALNLVPQDLSSNSESLIRKNGNLISIWSASLLRLCKKNFI